MSRRQTDDPLRSLPTLTRVGRELRELERREPARGDRSAPRRRRRAQLVGGGVTAFLLACAVALDVVGPAGALSIINRAPAAAVASSSVRFHSTISVLAGGRPSQQFTESGAINFRTGDYSTTLALGLGGGLIERRTYGGTFYITQVPATAARSARRHWLALRLAGGQRATFASAPERDAFTDPPVLFRAMAGTHARAIVIRHEDIAGVASTHYRLTTSLAAFLRAAYPAEPEPARLASVRGQFDVRLDRRGRPTQVQETFAGGSGSDRALISTRIIFSDYGAPVSVRRLRARRPRRPDPCRPQDPWSRTRACSSSICCSCSPDRRAAARPRRRVPWPAHCACTPVSSGRAGRTGHPSPAAPRCPPDCRRMSIRHPSGSSRPERDCGRRNGMRRS